MPKSSKKRNRNNSPERKAKRLSWEVARQEKKNLRIEAAVALPDYLDGTNYQLLFDKYNHQHSELHLLTPTSATSMIKKFTDITRYNNKSIAEARLIRDKVENTGEYANLYDGLRGDIELVEIQFSGNGGDGRIFCYFVNNHPHTDTISNYCVIVAVKCNHTRT